MNRGSAVVERWLETRWRSGFLRAVAFASPRPLVCRLIGDVRRRNVPNCTGLAMVLRFCFTTRAAAVAKAMRRCKSLAGNVLWQTAAAWDPWGVVMQTRRDYVKHVPLCGGWRAELKMSLSAQPGAPWEPSRVEKPLEFVSARWP